ncbi:hypothetical protein Tco_1060442 [Tanacetum coccineum]
MLFQLCLYGEEFDSVNNNQTKSRGEVRNDGDVDGSLDEEIRESVVEVNAENGDKNVVDDAGMERSNKKSLDGNENGNDGGGVNGKENETKNEASINKDDVNSGLEKEVLRESNDVYADNSNHSDGNLENANTNGNHTSPKATKSLNFAKTLTKNISDSGNQLFSVLTGLNSKGEEVVLFDKELVTEGSEKWQYTIYGYFVGCKMHVNELRYNTKRMWGRYGLKDIVVDADNMCFFKFKNEEAWSIKGISAICSRLGSPMMMDKITSEMCKVGSRRLGFARVLVEVDANKEFLDKIEINYVDGQKKAKPVVNFKPDVNAVKSTVKNTNNMDGNGEGFVEAMNRNNRVGNNGGIHNTEHGNKQPFQRRYQTQVKFTYQQKMPIVNDSNDEQNGKKNGLNKQNASVLSEEESEEQEVDAFIDNRLIVDEFIKKKMQPSISETKGWTNDMIKYFKYAWEAMEKKEK